MKNIYVLLFAIVMACALTNCTGDGYTYAMVETEFGNMKLRLFNNTPGHRDNFIKLAKEGYYDDLLFHRVIDGFMIQGGDPDSKNAPAGKRLGNGGPGYTIPAEFGAPHISGALAAARTPDQGNPEKKSSGSQFYIVHGRPQTDQQLDNIQRMKNITYSPAQRKLYKEKGGTPQLDMEYTVYGELVEGFEVVNKIATLQKDGSNRPLQDVKMKVKILD